MGIQLGNENGSPNEGEDGRTGSEFVRFVVVDEGGGAFEVSPEDYEACPPLQRPEPEYRRLKQLVANELGSRAPGGEVPKHIEYMRRHELVDYCDVSEKGHHKWYPKGVLMQQLIMDHAAQLAQEWGAFEMKNPLIIRGDHNAVGQLMGEFHERDYRVDGGRGECYLRYASDPLAFPYMQKVRFSKRQAPLKVFEEVSCFRNEQEGEVSGLKRVRNFLMVDMHAACASEEQARGEFEALSGQFAALMDRIIANGRWVFGWESTVAFYEEHKEWLAGMCKAMGVPAFFKLMPEMSHYYAVKNEFQFVSEDGGNIQISTVQWDVKDGARFDIGYLDELGERRPCPVILHASSFGSVERALCAILENIAHEASQGRPPMFPYWLAPTQARVIPVSDASVPFAEEVCMKLAQAKVRADVDDRDDTVGKKIRNGEQDWAPYVIVLGAREQETGQLSVRCREDGSQRAMPLDTLCGMLGEQGRGMPWRPLSLPVRLSMRPGFFG